MYHNVSGSTTWDVTMNIPIQKGKTYTIAYVVYEKVAPCGDYPPDGSVTFSQVVRAAMRRRRRGQCGAARRNDAQAAVRRGAVLRLRLRSLARCSRGL